MSLALNSYRTKAREDSKAIQRRVAALLTSVGRASDAISNDEIDLFCKYSAHLKVIRYRSLQEEYKAETAKGHDIGKVARYVWRSIAHSA